MDIKQQGKFCIDIVPGDSIVNDIITINMQNKLYYLLDGTNVRVYNKINALGKHR